MSRVIVREADGKEKLTVKSLHELIALGTLSVLTLSCDRTSERNDVVNRLPELPPQMATNLVATKIDNVYMTKSPPPVQKAPAVKPLAPNLRSCIKDYDAYVAYPLTVCFPPAEVYGGLEVAAAKAQTDPPGWSPASPPARYYKLSQSSSARSPNPPSFTVWRGALLCRASGGPWYATVRTKTSCDDRVFDQSILEIVGAPQPVIITWFGGINDIPPPFNSSMFAFEGEACTCCNGFTPCSDGRCLPPGGNCTISPAVKSNPPPK
jgi:hypothetical protein